MLEEHMLASAGKYANQLRIGHIDLAALGISKEFDHSKSPRVHLQRLNNCLDQKVPVVRHQITGSSALVLSVREHPAVTL